MSFVKIPQNGNNIFVPIREGIPDEVWRLANYQYLLIYNKGLPSEVSVVVNEEELDIQEKY